MYTRDGEGECSCMHVCTTFHQHLPEKLYFSDCIITTMVRIKQMLNIRKLAGYAKSSSHHHYWILRRLSPTHICIR